VCIDHLLIPFEASTPLSAALIASHVPAGQCSFQQAVMLRQLQLTEASEARQAKEHEERIAVEREQIALRREELAATKTNEKKRRQLDRERNVLERRQHKAFRSANKLREDSSDEDEAGLSEDEDQVRAREQKAQEEAQRLEAGARRQVDEENTKRKAGKVLPPLQFDVTWKALQFVNEARSVPLTLAEWIDVYEGDARVYAAAVEPRQWLRAENRRREGSVDTVFDFADVWKDFRQVNHERKLKKLPAFTFQAWVNEHGGNKMDYEFQLASAGESEGDESSNATAGLQ
jgi:hypothetical protein